MTLDRIPLSDRADPLVLAWPVAGNAAGILSFHRADEWREFIDGLGIDPRIPMITQAKFARSQALYLLGWIDGGLIKAGELAALIAVELAVMDRYGGCVPSAGADWRRCSSTWSTPTG